jgi:hypothetical protein
MKKRRKKKNSFSFGNSVYIFLLKTTRTKGQRPKESFNLLQTSIECKIKIKTRWRGHGPEFLFFSTEVASLHDLFESINIYIYIYIYIFLSYWGCGAEDWTINILCYVIMLIE